MADFEKEWRAHQMLLWNPYSFPNDFDSEFAASGAYTKAQRYRSGIALDAWDKAHEQTKSSELEAFKALEMIGQLTQSDYYSPTKAKDGYYTRRLREHQAAVAGCIGRAQAGDGETAGPAQGSRQSSGSNGTGGSPHGFDAEQSRRAQNRYRRQRR